MHDELACAQTGSCLAGSRQDTGVGAVAAAAVAGDLQAQPEAVVFGVGCERRRDRGVFLPQRPGMAWRSRGGGGRRVPARTVMSAQGGGGRAGAAGTRAGRLRL